MQITVKSVFLSRFTMYNIVPKLQKCWTHKIAFNIMLKKMLRHPNFFHSESSVLSKDAPAKFHLSATFGLSFMISSVASTCLSTFYTYLITKIRIHNLKSILTEFIKILFTFLVPKSLDVSWKILDLTGRSKKSSSFLPHN